MASDGKARKQDYAGGETHQIADDDHPVLTTNHGMPI